MTQTSLRKIVVSAEFLVDAGTEIPKDMGDIVDLIHDVETGTVIGRLGRVTGRDMSVEETISVLQDFGVDPGAIPGVSEPGGQDYTDSNGRTYRLDPKKALGLIFELAPPVPEPTYDNVARTMSREIPPCIIAVGALKHLIENGEGPRLRTVNRALGHERASVEPFVSASAYHAGNALEMVLIRAAHAVTDMEMAADGVVNDRLGERMAALDMIQDILILNHDALDFEIASLAPTPSAAEAPTP